MSDRPTKVGYGKPIVIDYGSIGAHTFTTPGGKPKDEVNVCELDPMFNEPSCSPG